MQSPPNLSWEGNGQGMLIEAFGSGQLCGQLVLDGSCCFRHSCFCLGPFSSMLTSIFVKIVQIFHFQESKNAGITDKRITFLGNSWHPFFIIFPSLQPGAFWSSAACCPTAWLSWTIPASPAMCWCRSGSVICWIIFDGGLEPTFLEGWTLWCLDHFFWRVRTNCFQLLWLLDHLRTHPFPPFLGQIHGISTPVPQVVAQRRSWAVLHLLHGAELRGAGAGGGHECAAGEHHLPVLSETWKTWGESCGIDDASIWMYMVLKSFWQHEMKCR